MADKELVITHLMIIHTWAEFARERDLQFFTSKHLEDIAQWSEDALALLKEQAWHLLKEDADGLIHGLPGDDGQYLMTDGEDIWIDDYVDGVDDGVHLDSGRDIREIKAWMYMPEPPKQEGL